MTISYPLTIPAYASGTSGTAGIDSLRFTNIHSVAMLRSPWSFATQTQQHSGEMFGAEVSIAPCNRVQAAPWIAFLASLRGPVGTFYLPVEKVAQTPRGAATGTPVVNGSVSSGSETIATKGWSNNITNILRKGDYIQIGVRLYQILSDHNTDGSGYTTVDVFPSVREALVDNTPITTSNPKGLFRLDSSEITTYEADAERLYSISFTAVEAL